MDVVEWGALALAGGVLVCGFLAPVLPQTPPQTLSEEAPPRQHVPIAPPLVPPVWDSTSPLLRVDVAPPVPPPAPVTTPSALATACPPGWDRDDEVCHPPKDDGEHARDRDRTSAKDNDREEDEEEEEDDERDEDAEQKRGHEARREPKQKRGR